MHTRSGMSYLSLGMLCALWLLTCLAMRTEASWDMISSEDEGSEIENPVVNDDPAEGAVSGD